MASPFMQVVTGTKNGNFVGRPNAQNATKL